MKRRMSIAAAALIAATLVAFFGSKAYLEYRVSHAKQELESVFPVGISLSDTRVALKKYGYASTEIPAADCGADSKLTVPDYKPQGGPCIFGLIDAGHTWWGFGSAVTFRLMFDGSGQFRLRQISQENTFL